MAAAARGKISPREGVGLAKLIEVFLKAIDTHDFDRRLQQLEHHDAAASSPWGGPV